MKTSDIIELVLAGLMVIGTLGVMIHRFKTGMGLGARAIQFIAVVLIVPSIVILSLEKVLSPETTATLFGAITGYLLSGIGEYKPPLSSKKTDTADRDSDQTQ
jgi:hypothetical protein